MNSEFRRILVIPGRRKSTKRKDTESGVDSRPKPILVPLGPRLGRAERSKSGHLQETPSFFTKKSRPRASGCDYNQPRRWAHPRTQWNQWQCNADGTKIPTTTELVIIKLQPGATPAWHFPKPRSGAPLKLPEFRKFRPYDRNRNFINVQPRAAGCLWHLLTTRRLQAKAEPKPRAAGRPPLSSGAAPASAFHGPCPKY